jgi:hypothetical protein
MLFGADTAKAMELLALATNVAVKPLDTDPGFKLFPRGVLGALGIGSGI